MMQEMFDAFGDYIMKKISEVHTAMPGSIVAFNPDTGLATVRPTVKFKTKDGAKIDYPDIASVPVVMPQASGCIIAYPIKPGDGCLIVISEQSNDYWLYGQETDTDLKYDLSNAIAIVGLSRIASPYLARACANNEVVLACGSNVLSVGSSGIAVSGNLSVTGTISAAAVNATSAKVGGINFGSHTHTAPAGGGQTSGPG